MTRAIPGLCLIAIIAFACAAPSVAPQLNLASPEGTISTYYRGYAEGNVDMINATFARRRIISPLGLGIDQTYRIEEKKRVLFSNRAGAAPGDIEIVVYVHVKWPDGEPTEMVTTFRLRDQNGKWKIVDYYSQLLRDLPVD
jgi:hypothetical protein